MPLDERAVRDAVARPALIVVLGAKGGVGATSVAIGLADALVRSRRPCVLVDAADSPGATLLCGSEAPSGVRDVLQGRTDFRSILRPSRRGFLLAPGNGTTEDGADYSAAIGSRMLAPLEALGSDVAAAVIDAGDRPGRKRLQFARAADALLLVTSPDPTAVWESFQTLRQLADSGTAEKTMLVVNRVPDARAAAAVHQRLSRVCRRFLGRDLMLAGTVLNGRQGNHDKFAFHALWPVSPYRAILRKINTRKESIFSRLLPIKGGHCR
ncbi:MAG: hypothetical protein JXB10_14945 [Pirellulales bacterium]|nr:hypothetical protein [Pirellulales bacterium]